tara:strand:- start:393 stop:497 length:105 start_codon:yes stop_codon:yes gene_type:complete
MAGEMLGALPFAFIQRNVVALVWQTQLFKRPGGS